MFTSPEGTSAFMFVGVLSCFGFPGVNTCFGFLGVNTSKAPQTFSCFDWVLFMQRDPCGGDVL